MKIINTEELDLLALGATLLGSGGGGNPAYDLLMAKQIFEEISPARIKALNEIDDDACVVPVAYMGAPLVCSERLPSGFEFEKLLGKLDRPVDYLVAAEIGGGNAFTALVAGARLGIPVIDGDTIGRAFPELQMTSCNLMGISPNPAFICSPLGHVMKMEASNAKELEDVCRQACVEMGSSCAIAIYVMTGKEAKKAIISGSVSQAIAMGRALNVSVEELLRVTMGREIGSGMIVDVDQEIKDGFLVGSFRIAGDSQLQVHYQNEYLAAYLNGSLVASTPDIIIAVDDESRKPITSESLQYGIRVRLLEFPSPTLWKTAEGMQLVGPEYFKIRNII